jgi:hypothetical protein
MLNVDGHDDSENQRGHTVSIIWTAKGPFQRTGYASAADLESAILQVKEALFGPGRIYLDVKRRIGSAKGSLHKVSERLEQARTLDDAW